MKYNAKTIFKLIGVYTFGFVVVDIVLTAWGLLLSKWFGIESRTFLGFILQLPIGVAVWMMFLRWGREIRFIYKYKKDKNIQV